MEGRADEPVVAGIECVVLILGALASLIPTPEAFVLVGVVYDECLVGVECIECLLVRDSHRATKLYSVGYGSNTFLVLIIRYDGVGVLTHTWIGNLVDVLVVLCLVGKQLVARVAVDRIVDQGRLDGCAVRAYCRSVPCKLGSCIVELYSLEVGRSGRSVDTNPYVELLLCGAAHCLVGSYSLEHVCALVECNVLGDGCAGSARLREVERTVGIKKHGYFASDGVAGCIL